MSIRQLIQKPVSHHTTKIKMMGVTFSREKSTVSTTLQFASSFTMFIFSNLSLYHILATKGRYFILVRQQFSTEDKNKHHTSEVDDIDNSEVVSFKTIPKLTVSLNSKNLHIELSQKVLLVVHCESFQSQTSLMV
jgi:hypothetical protein